ncbi:MAG: GNAT family N-acetyltransferase [Nocardioidaceae bacterium]|nr:GNAT family N-acetyltransferase [Nocardioidaceae bacterium]
MTSRVRARRDDDLGPLVAILGRTHRLDAYPVRAARVDAAWLVEHVLVAWVVELDGFVAGHVALQDGGVDVLEVVRLFVDPDARGHGLGGALLDVVDGHARQVGATLTLDVVDDDRAAIALYERRGWRRTGSRTADWSAPDAAPPVVLTYVLP